MTFIARFARRETMIDLTREMIAYAIIGLVIVVGVPVIGVILHKRKREKLRRRGIKRYGH